MSIPERKDPDRIARCEAVWSAIRAGAIKGKSETLAQHMARFPTYWESRDNTAEAIGSERSAIAKMIRTLRATGLLVYLGERQTGKGQWVSEYVIDKGCLLDTPSRRAARGVKRAEKRRQDRLKGVSKRPKRGVQQTPNPIRAFKTIEENTPIPTTPPRASGVVEEVDTILNVGGEEPVPEPDAQGPEREDPEDQATVDDLAMERLLTPETATANGVRADGRSWHHKFGWVTPEEEHTKMQEALAALKQNNIEHDARPRNMGRSRLA